MSAENNQQNDTNDIVAGGNNLQKKIDALQEMLGTLRRKIDTLRVSIKYQVFDLEATRRESYYKIKALYIENECLEVANELLRNTLKKVIGEDSNPTD